MALKAVKTTNSEGYPEIHIQAGYEVLATVHHLGRDRETEWRELANKFAAAEELLETLKGILAMNPSPHDDGDHNDFTDLIIKAERLIVKAEGK